MSVASDITALTTKLTTIFNQIKTSLTNKGVSVLPSDFSEVPAKIDSIVIGSGAQIFDFYLETEGSTVTLTNVDFGTAGVTGLMLYPVSGVSAGQEGAIYAVWSYPGVTGIGKKYFYSANYSVIEESVGGTPVVYNAAEHTLTILVSGLSWIVLKPGQYKLIAW